MLKYNLHRQLWEYTSPQVDRVLKAVIPYHREEFLAVVEFLEFYFTLDLIDRDDPRRQVYLTWRRKMALDINAAAAYSEWVHL